jgi:hypothetical protein
MSSKGRVGNQGNTCHSSRGPVNRSIRWEVDKHLPAFSVLYREGICCQVRLAFERV